jgi:hypothetical protein
LAASPAIAQAAGFSAHGAPNKRVSHGTSINWSGYASSSAGAGKYTSVSASWTQPAVNCLQTPNGYSAFWTGLDGDFTSNTVEQTGTEADCSSGSAVYYEWYEMYPKSSVNYSYPLSAGDKISASVSYLGSGLFKLTLHDATKNWTLPIPNQRLKSAKLASAEAIIEAPYSGGVLPLADFGTASFTGSSLAGLPGLDPIKMVSQKNAADKTGWPSAINSSTGAFNESWVSAGP